MSRLSDYRRELVLYVLSAQVAGATSQDLAEAMIGCAQVDGHPDECWRGITPLVVAGYLRQLEADGKVVRNGERRNPRYRRPEPVWQLVPETSAPAMPRPPEPDELAAGDGAESEAPALVLTPPEPPEPCPYDGYTRDELIAICTAQDQALQGHLAAERAKSEASRALVLRLRADLAKVGL